MSLTFSSSRHAILIKSNFIFLKSPLEIIDEFCQRFPSSFVPHIDLPEADDTVFNAAEFDGDKFCEEKCKSFLGEALAEPVEESDKRCNGEINASSSFSSTGATAEARVGGGWINGALRRRLETFALLDGYG